MITQSGESTSIQTGRNYSGYVIIDIGQSNLETRESIAYVIKVLGKEVDLDLIGTDRVEVKRIKFTFIYRQN